MNHLRELARIQREIDRCDQKMRLILVLMKSIGALSAILLLGIVSAALADEATGTLTVTLTVQDEATISSEDMEQFCRENGLLPSECMVDPAVIEEDG